MNIQQLQKCIALGEAIADGAVDLVELDEKSLAVRGKKGKGKRKRERENGDEESPRKEPRKENSKAKHVQLDIRTSMTGSPAHNPPTTTSSLPFPPSPSSPSPALTTLITSSPITPFRKRVLLALLQVPRGHYTTYAALSDHLHSCPRAVGNAMRNNPFAPEVPCHRVVAADGGLGGFGGEWGEGVKRGEKVRLLRGEGVRVDEGRGRVIGGAWRGFV